MAQLVTGHSQAHYFISSVDSDLFLLSQRVHLCVFTMHVPLPSRKDPGRLYSRSHEAACVISLAIDHTPPCDRSSVASNCYVNLVPALAWADQTLLPGGENNSATFEADQRKYPVCHRALAAGDGEMPRAVTSTQTMARGSKRTHSP